MGKGKERIDLLLVERGLAETRNIAQRLVMAGQVRADGQVVPKPASKVDPDAELAVDSGPRFVSRGGEKLEAALEAFGLDVSGWVCADVGASTGGFSDCLLQRGAAKVYAIDVGHGVLHWKLRNDPRVVVMERTNARSLEALPEPIRFASLDASFISLQILLPVVAGWLAGPPAGGADLVCLVKPQFEAGRREAARAKGVIRDPAIHRRVLEEVLTAGQDAGLRPRGLLRSPVLGPKGNVEFLAWFTNRQAATAEIAALVANVMD